MECKEEAEQSCSVGDLSPIRLCRVTSHVPSSNPVFEERGKGVEKKGERRKKEGRCEQKEGEGRKGKGGERIG